MDFEVDQYVVYPAHGVGQIRGIEQQEVAGCTLTMVVIFFEKDRLSLRLPYERAKSSGLRALCSQETIDEALKTLRTPLKHKRMMWSRRAQEYETKINSGDPVSIAQVVRDLYRSSEQPDQSYSERHLYQSAMDRLIREYAAVEKINEDAALKKLEEVLSAA